MFCYTHARRQRAEKKSHVDTYNKSMGGVDPCDMMLPFYKNTMKSRKWYNRLIFHLILNMPPPVSDSAYPKHNRSVKLAKKSLG